MNSKKAKVKTAAFEQVDPVFAFQEDKIVFRDGRVGLGFAVEPVEMERWDVDAYTAFANALQAAFRVLPAETLVQKTDVYYHRPSPIRSGDNTPTYFEGKLHAHFAGRPVLFHRVYLFFSFAPSVQKKPVRTSALNALAVRLGESVIKNPYDGLEETLGAAERAGEEFVQALRNVGGLAFNRLTNEQVRNLYLQYFNLEFDKQPTHLSREIGNEPGLFTVGEHRVNVVSLTGQGNEAHPVVSNTYDVASPMLYPLTHFLQCPHILTQAMLVQNTREALKDLDLDKKLNNSLANMATQDNRLRVAQIDEFTADIRSNNKLVVSLHLSCLLWDTNDQARRENVERTAAAFRSMFGAECVIESYLTLPLFFGCLPGAGYQIPDRWLTTSSDRGACYFHWTTTYRPDPKGELLCDRFRNLVRVDMFNTALDNQNALVIGPSGSGKSYTFGNFIVQRFERGARQIIIDIGGTYRNVFQSLTGTDFENTYFEYDPQNPIEFNPFLLPRHPETGRWMYNDEKTNFHLAMLAALWKGSKDRVLSKSERTILTRFLHLYYRHLNEHPALGQNDEEFPGMDGFYYFVKAYDKRMYTEAAPTLAAAKPRRTRAKASAVPDGPVAIPPVPEPPAEDEALALQRMQYQTDMKYIDMNEFFLVLGEFVTGGRYGKVLNSLRDKDLSEYRLICFDLARVKSDPTLYPLVAMLITELSLDLFRKFPDDVKYIALDEAWAMLSGVLEEFIVSMYRTIRKTNGSITVITQGIQEIIDSPIGYTLIDNSSTKIILRHSNEATLNRVQQPLGFTEHEMDLVRSVRSTDKFREFFVKQGSYAKIYALEASPQLDAILTSKPVERNYLNKLVKHYQRQRPVPMRDEHGQIMRDEHGQVVYTTVIEQRLDFAVDQFVEDKLARRGALAV